MAALWQATRAEFVAEQLQQTKPQKTFVLDATGAVWATSLSRARALLVADLGSLTPQTTAARARQELAAAPARRGQ